MGRCARVSEQDHEYELLVSQRSALRAERLLVSWLETGAGEERGGVDVADNQVEADGGLSGSEKDVPRTLAGGTETTERPTGKQDGGLGRGVCAWRARMRCGDTGA